MPIRRDGNEDELRALDAYVKLRRASESISARLHSSIKAMRLTESQFGILEALYHLGSMCQADLGKKILKSNGNITMVVDNLEKRELVNRVRGAADRRYVSVELTAAGQTLMREAFPGHVQAIVAQMSTLSAAEQDELARLCRKLGLQSQEA